MQKIKDKGKEGKSEFFFLLGWLSVSTFVLSHWLEMLHAHSS